MFFSTVHHTGRCSVLFPSYRFRNLCNSTCPTWRANNSAVIFEPDLIFHFPSLHTQQIWDMLDLWHYKLNELDAEVQDIVEQDSCHAQELMDILVTPLQQYQQVSQLAERRTAILNKVDANVKVLKKIISYKKQNKGFA